MNTELWIYLLLAIIFVVALIFIIVWITILSQPPVFPEAPVYSNSGYGMRCNINNSNTTNNTNQPATFEPSNCDLGLVCAAGFCKKDIGTACNTLFECVPGTLVCNGTCSATGKGSLNSICSNDNDCDNIFVCDTSLIIPLCKRPIGSTPCLITDDCVSNSVCANNICLPISSSGEACLPLENNNSCQENDVCLNFEDNFYFCQPTNTIPGEQNSVCYFWNDILIGQPLPPIKNVTIENILNTVPSCQNGFICSSIGDFTSINEYGQCIDINNSAGWFDQCSENNPCQASQVCLNNNCVFPTITNSNNLIEYSPLSCENGESSGFCLTNTTCSSVNNKRKCVGNNFNIPAINNDSCLNGIGSNYSIVQQTFADINSSQTDRLTTSSWTNSNLIVPNYINSGNIDNVNFSSFEDNTVIKVIFHLIGNNFYNINNTTININNGIHGNVIVGANTYFGKVSKVGYTTSGNYYCIIEYVLTAGVGDTNFSNIYISTLSNFGDSIPYCKPYNVKYYIGGNLQFNSRYLYSVSVDDRPINNNLNLRIFFVSGNNGPLANNLYTQAGRLCSIEMNGPSISSISNNLNLFSFDLLSYNLNYITIDSSLVYCSAFLSRTMDISQASKYCYAYSVSASQTRIYGPNPTNINTNVAFTSGFPFINKNNLKLKSINIYNSRSIDLFNNPCYYIANQGNNIDYSNQIFLGLSWINQDVVLPADVNLSTLLSVTYTNNGNDIPGYRPKILLLTKVCN